MIVIRLQIEIRTHFITICLILKSNCAKNPVSCRPKNIYDDDDVIESETTGV